MLISVSSLLPLTLLPTTALSNPLPLAFSLETRQSATTCGSTSYTATDTRNCKNAAYNYYQQGTTAGSSSYPHTYNNYEGFDFPVSGPYQEFPYRRGVHILEGLLVLIDASSIPMEPMRVPSRILVLVGITLSVTLL